MPVWRTDATAEDDADEDDADLEPPRPLAYRVSGGLEARAAGLEQALAAAREDLRKAEQEVWAARRILRTQQRLRVTSIGGLGALVGSVVGSGLYWWESDPRLLVGSIIVGFLFGVVGGSRWEPPNDGFTNPSKPPRGLLPPF